MARENQTSLLVNLSANVKDFNKKMKNVQGTLKNVSKKMMSIGKTLAMSITAPLVGFGALSIKAFDNQIQVQKQLEVALEANGRQVKALMQDYTSFAKEIQATTTIGDEAVLGMLKMAESMGLTGESAKTAVKEAIGMQEAFGVNAESAMRYTSALASGDATMLKRYIPSLRGIKDEAEMTAKAHEILAKTYKQAEEGALHGLGPLHQIKNSFGDLMEEVGAVVLDLLKPFVGWLKDMVASFSTLTPESKRFLVVFGLIIAALPIAIMLFSVLSSVIAFMTSPIGLAILALMAIVTAFVYIQYNWEAFKERMSDWNWWRNAILTVIQWMIRFNPFALLMEGVNSVITFFGGDPIPDPFLKMRETLEGLKVETKEYEHQFKSFGETMMEAGGDLLGNFTGEMSDEDQETLDNILAGIPSDGEGEGEGGTGGTGPARSALALAGDLIALKQEEIALAQNQAVLNEDDLIAKNQKVQLLKKELEELQNLGIETDTLDEKVKTLKDTFLELAEAMGQSLRMGAENFKEFGKSVKNEIRNVIKGLIAQGIAGAVANAIKSSPPWLIPIVAGMASGLANTAFNALVPEFAEGGIVTQPTMGLIGEAGPEAIFPLSKLDSFMKGGSGGPVQVQGVLTGTDIMLSNSRTSNNLNRIGG